ncbi:CD3e molecule, epsilon associated protein [Mugil cephalus]|uniref:CD3e molecule, epsilon associated protein n=1 Tax=Mugil cephalus TaxID=48193 RepID=UPI001FB5B042|nr:CD3e molecule, epsilon associated protein [Mugil cephalus]
MPKDISSSSSEDEADSPAPESAAKQKETEKTTRYRCPADFVSFSHVPCSSTLTSKLKKNNNELWLIKAPASFNPECFRNIKVPLSGLHTLKVPSAAGGAATGGVQQIYSILASDGCTSDIRLLTSDKQPSDRVALAPTFSGMLNVCESYGGSSTDRPPHIIPAAPAPSIPPGLRQRFHPFGSKAPILAAENEMDGAALEPPPATKRFFEDTGHDEEQEEEEGRKKKKKKKKEKRIKTEVTEQVVEVKEEPVAEGQEEMMVEHSFQEDDHSEEKRKKKKKKKDKEREREAEEGLEPSVEVKVEEITVKPEPIDSSYGDAAEDSGKKKKKKKKSKTGDD